MVDGVPLERGQRALFQVREEYRQGSGPALTLPQRLAELTVKDRALRLRIAVLTPTVQVDKIFISSLHYRKYWEYYLYELVVRNYSYCFAFIRVNAKT